MDERYMRGDMRRLPPRNSRGEFRRRRSRRDRGMDMGYETDDMARYDMRHEHRGGRMGGMARGEHGYDGHYPMHSGRSGGYEPVEFMGYCTGYAGAKEDYGYPMYGDMRGRGRDYGYPMHQRHYPPYDYGYDDYGDYGETLSDKELEEWSKRLRNQLDEREKQMFSKEAISQKARQMNKSMEGFGEKELEVATLMVYTDYKHSIGQNPDLAVKLAYDWLADKDVAVKGAEKLAVYYDCIVEGNED